MRTLSLAAATLALCLGARAGAATDVDVLPPAHTQGSVTYSSGGIATDQQAAMRRAASDYPLEVTFVESNAGHGLFTADVHVTITDRAGNIVLDTRSDGPYLLARLPNGRYTITADNTGRITSRQVTIEPGIHRAVIFDWKA